MATTSSVAVPAGDVWTLLYTAAGTVTLFVQNMSNDTDLLVRVGSATATSDSAQAAAEQLYSYEGRSIALVSGDKVHARSKSPSMAAKATIRV